ncbi:hypothetical protein Esi_0115_0021 [Ectocarpus siliculosus]|uniref:C2 domain-containing protein n=1 Tax=Ectocarpus siliculosus TaxID=2880 RepID=D7FHX2_ECTSI|nr:hypothetical protein Esi_0115_0021 [Ectocarpus siliculosus]|eukprot:CBJ48983.1 hypothetical protein Esi_0115_0021 [Ectocarpus siliculosus]
MSSPKRQLPMHLDKWVITVREGKDLTRGEANDFFRKMSPVCELTLGSQGPFSTGVKLNTTQPCWDDSIEFDAATAAAALLLSPPRPSKTKPPSSAVGGGDSENNDDDDLRLPTVGPKLEGSQVPAGSVILEYMLVPGIPQPVAPVSTETEGSLSGLAARTTAPFREDGGNDGSRGGVGSCCMDELKKPARKPALLACVGAVIAAVLAVRLSGVCSARMPTDLSPIPVPFKVAVGKHKGSSTHHIRLQGDGNVVVARGPKPLLTAGAAAAGDAGATLWQSGPLPSLTQQQQRSPGKPGDNGKDKSGGGSGGSCKKCQVKVTKEGTLALTRGREELAVFSPAWTEAFFDIPPRGDKW